MNLTKEFNCLPHALLIAILNAIDLSTARVTSTYLSQMMQRDATTETIKFSKLVESIEYRGTPKFDS